MASIEAAYVRNASMNLVWMYTYCFTLLFSCSMTLLAAYHLRQLHGDLFRSTVRFVIVMVFFSSTLHTLAGGVFYASLIYTLTSVVDHYQDDALNTSSSVLNTSVSHLLRTDGHRDGGEAAYVSKLTHEAMPLSPTLTALLFAENLAFLLSAYWLFVLAWELYQLAMRTLDRGKQHENVTIWNHIWRIKILKL
ncbi:hypothetical protein CCR75_006614 [Bremia lactucae]|uniref:Uncharacterized protein n=1 Tax=Bremia lactucae TaxID=4779 RepID=A0A976FH19_BRELC|nr:hypothetical protein CCR75_006614 [Bremia lactucae]